MSAFLLALQFLTIIPIKLRHFREEKAAGALIYFPLVGLFLGIILTAFMALLSAMRLEELAISALVIVLLAILTGGLHLDGLADTFDALLSRKKKEEMLAIMRDSRIGAMGVMALICVIILKICLLYSLDYRTKAGAMILVCVISRWSMVSSMFLFHYARQEGKAKYFMHGINLKIFILSTIIALTVVFLVGGFRGVVALLIVFVVTCLFNIFITIKIGGLTGDTLGSSNEIAEVITLFLCGVMHG